MALSDAWLPSKTNGRRYIDLFAGSGGLSLGLLASGWEGVFAVEKDAMAFETLHENLLNPDSPFASYRHWPDWLEKKPHDILDLLQDVSHRQQLAGLVGTVDLVAGGPPCQGFSVGGARRGENDPRNDLPFHFVDFVSLVRPKMVLLENVEGFDKPFTHQGHKTSYADVVADEFRSLGYRVVKRTIHAVQFGVPQTRRRVVLFGVHDSVSSAVEEMDLGWAFDAILEQESGAFFRTYLPNTRCPVGAREAIDDLHGGAEILSMPDAPRFGSVSYRPAESEYSALMRSVGYWEVPDSHRIPRHSDVILNLIETAQQTQKAGRLSQEFLRKMGTKSRKKFLLDPELPASTLTSHPDEFFHYSEPRIITLREAARLQSFPDRFQFKGRYTLNGDRRGLDVSRCIQIGNAIPPLMARGLGASVSRLIDYVEAGSVPDGDADQFQRELALSSGAPVLF